MNFIMKNDERRVLIVSQLPKEAGGNYTTGIARVAENLYQMRFDSVKVFWYFTNVPNKVAISKCHFKYQYNGYRIIPLQMLWNILKHPFKTLKEWSHYRKIDKVNPLRYEFYKANFMSIIGKIRPSVIHLHGSSVSPLYYAKEGANAKFLLTFHGIMYNPEDAKSLHFKPWYDSLMPMADFFTVLNKETERKAINLGMPKDRFVVIPNGVDTERFYFSEKDRDMLREKIGATEDCVVFMTTGAVIDRKGQFDFIQILQSLNINYQYWIIGEGVDVHKIQQYSETYGLSARIKLLGYVDGRELYKYLSASDIYAHVSTTEGQALSEIEAYATGLKIIVRKEIMNTVIGDVDHDQDNYYVLDFNNYDAASILMWINKKPFIRTSRDKYAWKSVAKQYDSLYNTLLG